MPDRAPTYWTTEEDDHPVYHCGHCVHWATDFALFKAHMEQQHDGIMIETPPKPPEPEPTPPEPEPTPEPLPAPDPDEPVPVEAEGV